VSEAFTQIKAELPGLGLAAAIFNVGGQFVRTPFLELSKEAFLTGHETNGYDKLFPTTDCPRIHSDVCHDCHFSDVVPYLLSPILLPLEQLY
jgi:hypothetical protein